MNIIGFNKTRGNKARIASGNTVAALKYLRKLDKKEEKKKNETSDKEKETKIL